MAFAHHHRMERQITEGERVEARKKGPYL